MKQINKTQTENHTQNQNQNQNQICIICNTTIVGKRYSKRPICKSKKCIYTLDNILTAASRFYKKKRKNITNEELISFHTYMNTRECDYCGQLLINALSNAAQLNEIRKHFNPEYKSRHSPIYITTKFCSKQCKLNHKKRHQNDHTQ